MPTCERITVRNLSITLKNIEAYCGAVRVALESIKNPRDVEMALPVGACKVILGPTRKPAGVCPPPWSPRSRKSR